MNFKFITTSILILCLRVVDLITTYDSIVDFSRQEMNVFIKIFNIGMWEFFTLEIILAFGMIGLYFYSEKFSDDFKITTISLKTYAVLFLYGKESIRINEYMFKIKYQSIAVLVGSLVPVFIISTSVLYILNNLLVNSVVKGNKSAIKYYYLLDNYYFFDILIFVLPPFFLCYLTYKKMSDEFLKNHSVLS